MDKEGSKRRQRTSVASDTEPAPGESPKVRDHRAAVLTAMLCAMAEPTENKRKEPASSEPTKNKHEEPEPSRRPENEDEVSEASEATEDEELEAPAPAERARKERSASSGSVVRWLAAAALVVALGALGISLWVLLRPPSTDSSAASATTAPSPQQTTDAKTRVCGAYDTVGAAVTLRINANPGPDPAAAQAEAVDANTRLALAVGYSYLLSHLDPATPAPIADAMRRFADDLHEIAINSLAGVNSDDPAQAGRLQNMLTLNTQILDLCK
jgi:hypothetical protein